MEKTPLSMRKYVSIFGDVNAGKSTLFNGILGQEVAIITSYPGTTTDPIVKAMELIPFGPIALVDTAGFSDSSVMGEERIKKTNQIIDSTNYAIYAININDFSEDKYLETTSLFKKKNIPFTIVFTNINNNTKELVYKYKNRFTNAFFMHDLSKESFAQLRSKIAEALTKSDVKEKNLINGILKDNSLVLAVVAIDAAAPKGRLILPQVQFIRECLDHGIKCLVTRENELENALDDVKKVDLVVTDSQIFKEVDKIVPKSIPLTSFSILLANQKGDIDLFAKSATYIDKLKDHDKILMAEACKHNSTHEDIGRIKIPTLMKKYTNKDLKFEFYTGYDFPEDLDEYALVIHCGACMINNKAIQHRLSICNESNIPITNYGVVLAYLNGILSRSIEIFESDGDKKKHD